MSFRANPELAEGVVEESVSTKLLALQKIRSAELTAEALDSYLTRDDMIRSMFKFHRKVVRALIYHPTSKQVLVIKSYFSSGFCLPGGGVEKNEMNEQSIVRELREELGIKPTDIQSMHLDKTLHSSSRLFIPLKSDIAVFVVRLSAVSIKSNFEIRHWLWVDEEDAETLLKKYYANPF